MSVLTDGLGTKITLTVAGAPAAPVVFYEKSVKPLGYDSGGKIDTTGLRNQRYRTGAPKALITPTAITAKVAYDPAIYPAIEAIAGVVGDCTVTYPNGDEITVAGCWLDKFEPDEITEGNQPTATMTVEMGNSADGLPDGEVAPTFSVFE